jgi:putative membrane protein
MFGCASSASDIDEPTAATTVSEPALDQHEDTPPATADTAPAAPAPETRAAATNETLDDAQILGVVKVANETGVATSQLAAQKAMTPEVREYAQDLVQDHLVTGQHVDQTATSAPPGGSETATTWIQRANVELESLSAKSGADFDRAYVESQIENHQELLASIERTLLPQADRVAVRQLLESMRTKVGEHLEQARELQQQLASVAG